MPRNKYLTNQKSLAEFCRLVKKSIRYKYNPKFIPKNNQKMPKTKKLQNKISNKLDQLSKLLDKIDEVRAINSDDPETWDSDTFYNLVENLKETLKLLEDKTHPKQKDSFGEPLILEVGLCSLLDEYHADEEEIHDD